MKRIMWTTVYLFKKAIKEAYLDYYGVNISDECVVRIVRHHKNLLSDNTAQPKTKQGGDDGI